MHVEGRGGGMTSTSSDRFCAITPPLGADVLPELGAGGQ